MTDPASKPSIVDNSDWERNTLSDLRGWCEWSCLGGKLTNLNLLHPPILDGSSTEFIGGKRQASKVIFGSPTMVARFGRWQGGSKAKFKADTNGFRSTPGEVRNFRLGGVQFCEILLKIGGAKKGTSGRILSDLIEVKAEELQSL